MSHYGNGNYLINLERDPNMMGMHIKPQDHPTDMPPVPRDIHDRLRSVAEFFGLPHHDDKPVLTVGWNFHRCFFTIRQRERVARNGDYILVDSHVVDLVDNNFEPIMLNDERIWAKLDECFTGKTPADRMKALLAKKEERAVERKAINRKMAEDTVVEAEPIVRKIFDGHSKEAVAGRDKVYSIPTATPEKMASTRAALHGKTGGGKGKTFHKSSHKPPPKPAHKSSHKGQPQKRKAAK